MQTILGAGGAIGIPLASYLKKYTNELRLVSRTPKKVNPDDELFTADLTDREAVDRAVSGSEVVYLCPGLTYDHRVWRDLWPRIMENTLAACQHHGARLVFFDNIYMYDRDYLGHMTEETPIRPTSKKGEVRARIAEMLMQAVESGEVQGLIARSPDFLSLRNSVPGEMLAKNFLSGKKGNWIARLDKVHTCILAEDAARATAILGNDPEAFGQVWHLPTPKDRLTGQDWVDLFAKAAGVEPRVQVLPIWLMQVMGWFVPIMRELAEMAYQYDRDYGFDSSKFEAKYPFEITAPSRAVQLVVEGMRKQD